MSRQKSESSERLEGQRVWQLWLYLICTIITSLLTLYDVRAGNPDCWCVAGCALLIELNPVSANSEIRFLKLRRREKGSCVLNVATQSQMEVLISLPPPPPHPPPVFFFNFGGVRGQEGLWRKVVGKRVGGCKAGVFQVIVSDSEHEVN